MLQSFTDDIILLRKWLLAVMLPQSRTHTTLILAQRVQKEAQIFTSSL